MTPMEKEANSAADQPKTEGSSTDTGVTPVSNEKAATFKLKLNVFADGTKNPAISSLEALAVDSPVGGNVDSVSNDARQLPGAGDQLVGLGSVTDRANERAEKMYDGIAITPTTVKLKSNFDGEVESTDSDGFKLRRQKNRMYQLKSLNSGACNEFGAINRKTPIAASTKKMLYVRGQHDDDTVAKLYPTRVTADDGTVSTVAIAAGNYALLNMKFVVTNGELSDVQFVTQELECSTNTGLRDMTHDYARTRMAISDGKISDWAQYTKDSNDPKYDAAIPIVKGVPEPAKYLALAEDIAVSDGAILLSAYKSLAESYAYATLMRKCFGGRAGSRALAAAMGGVANPGLSANIQRASALQSWTAMEHYSPSKKDVANQSIASIASVLESTSGWNDMLGSLMGLKTIPKAFANANSAIDNLEYITDSAFYDIMNQMFGWYKDSDAGMLCGVDEIGLILPYDPATYFEYRAVNGGTEKELDGKCHVVGYYNDATPVVASIGSKLFRGMVEYFKSKFLPSLKNKVKDQQWSGTVNIPFDFSTNRFSAGALFIALAAPTMATQWGGEYVNGYYDNFAKQVVDPFMDGTTTKVTTSDILSKASFRGLGVQPVVQEAGAGLKLIMSDPEFIRADIQAVANTTGTGSHFIGAFTVNNGVVDMDIDDSSSMHMLRPIVIDMNTSLIQLERLMNPSSMQIYKTRDLPVNGYQFRLAAGAKMGANLVGALVSELRDPSVIYTDGNHIAIASEDGKNTSITLQVRDVFASKRCVGRIAPMPMNALNNAVQGTAGVFDTNIVDVNHSDQLIGGKVSVDIVPIETYDFVYLIDSDDYNAGKMGSANYADAYFINSGGATAAKVKEIINAGFLLDADPMTAVAKTPLYKVKVDSNEMHVTTSPDVAAALWSIEFGYPFFNTPFEGVMDVELASGAAAFDDRWSQRVMEAFGLKYYGIVDFSEYIDDVLQRRNDVNTYLDYTIERSGSLLL